MSGVHAPAVLDDASVLVEDVCRTVRANAASTDEEAAFPVAALQELRRTRLLGLLVPCEYGGPGGTYASMVDITARLSREDMSVGMVFAMHCQQVAAVVSAAGPQLKRQLLPRVARGEVYLASVTTEPRTGGHLLSSAAALRSDHTTLHLDRSAPVVTGGAHADGFLVTMQAPGAESPTQVSLVYADRAQLRATVVGGWQPLGMRATHSVPMRLVGDVPDSQLVGEHGRFRDVAVNVFAPLAHLGWSAAWLGTAAGALSRTVRFLRTPEGRAQFDVGSELLLSRLAAVRCRLDVVHALLQQALRATADPGALGTPPVQLLLNALKIQAAEQCFAAVDGLIELVGLRHGYLRGSELALERAFRDLRSASLNYANTRLYLADGRLTLLDGQVRFG